MPKNLEHGQTIVHLKERVPVILTAENPYLGKNRKAGDEVFVSPQVAEKGIRIGHYKKAKSKE